jgi:hypothetical protein
MTHFRYAIVNTSSDHDNCLALHILRRFSRRVQAPVFPLFIGIPVPSSSVFFPRLPKSRWAVFHSELRYPHTLAKARG